MFEAELIANHMCDVTEDVLWTHIRPWVLKRYPQTRFKARIGPGKSTYCQYNRTENIFTLNYGKKMIMDKMVYQHACRWLTAAEIQRFGYYGGQLSLLNLLAHCVVHETGHILQMVLGGVYDNTMHSKGFYHILNRMHQHPTAIAIKSELHNRCLKQCIDLNGYWRARRA